VRGHSWTIEVCSSDRCWIYGAVNAADQESFGYAREPEDGGFVIVANVFCDRAGELPNRPGNRDPNDLGAT